MQLTSLFPFLKNPRIAIPVMCGIFVLALIGISFLIVSSKKTQSTKTSEQNSPNKKNQAITNLSLPSSSSLTYGYWSDSKSHIVKLDLSTGLQEEIATLPFNIKKVTVLKNGDLVYINQTDNKDSGKEIMLYSPANNTSKTIYKTESSFSIDSYVISPNESYISIWELAYPDNSRQLQGGKSQVIAKEIKGDITHVIYSEDAVAPVHYPRAILNDGTVICDSFVPNDGAGWAYGMSISDFSGQTHKDIVSMTNGTYSTQPFLSVDGKSLVFVGYNGSKGDGAEKIHLFRRALTMGNTIDMLDIATLTRKTLVTATSNTIFNSARFDNNGMIIYTSISKNSTQNETFIYNPNSYVSQGLGIGDKYMYLDSVYGSKALIGIPDISQSTIGNLGANYSPTYSSLMIMDRTSKAVTVLNTNGILTQFISVTTPSPTALSVNNEYIAAAIDPNATQNLHLGTIGMKPRLSSERQGLHNSEYCVEIAVAQCAAVHNETQYWQCVEDPHGESATRIGNRNFSLSAGVQCLLASTNTPFKACVDKSFFEIAFLENCLVSPLYLYGPEGTKLSITMGTPIASYGPNYKGKFDVILKSNNTFEIDGDRYRSIEYSYLSAKKDRTAPLYGKIVSLANLTPTIIEYAQKLGLNNQETSDLIKSALSTVKKPYVFVSFYDQATSKEILPISFDPQPDVYANYVFYFKGIDSLPKKLPEPIDFPEKISRGNITAVEISEIFE